MIRKMNRLILALSIALILNSCYYDSVQELYPVTVPCDTTNVTYSQDVWPVIGANCTSCHSGSAPSGNILLSNYDEIVVQAKNGNLIGAITHAPGYSPMPKDGSQLPPCNITHIQVWINNGTPDN